MTETLNGTTVETEIEDTVKHPGQIHAIDLHEEETGHGTWIVDEEVDPEEMILRDLIERIGGVDGGGL